MKDFIWKYSDMSRFKKVSYVKKQNSHWKVLCLFSSHIKYLNSPDFPVWKQWQKCFTESLLLITSYVWATVSTKCDQLGCFLWGYYFHDCSSFWSQSLESVLLKWNFEASSNLWPFFWGSSTCLLSLPFEGFSPSDFLSLIPSLMVSCWSTDNIGWCVSNLYLTADLNPLITSHNLPPSFVSCFFL